MTGTRVVLANVVSNSMVRSRAIADAHLIVETKGFEDVEVARKDAAGRRWCKAASDCDDAEWRFLKVGEAAFRSEAWTSLAELEAAIGLAGD